MPFRNSIVGGMSKLIRAAIQSPNYVTGVSGWSINKDGTAEFNGITVRGTILLPVLGVGTPPAVTTGAIIWQDGYDHHAAIYQSNPANGSYVAIIAGRNNADPDYAFLEIGGVDGATRPQFTLANFVANSGNKQVLILQGGNIVGQTDPGGIPRVNIGGSAGAFAEQVSIDGLALTVKCTTELQKAVTVDAASSLQLLAGATLQVGAGGVGKYYYEEWTGGAQSIPNSAFTALLGMTLAKSLSDYATAMNTVSGVWTCPVTGIYTFHILVGFTAWVANSRMAVGILDDTSGFYLGFIDLASPSGAEAVSCQIALTAGDFISFVALQVTGVAKIANGLAGFQTRMSARRVL